MNKKNHILMSIFCFIFSFFLFLGIFVGIAKVSLMNESYILSVLEETKYYDGIAKELNDDLANGAGAAGFYPDIYNKFVTGEEVEKISVSYIKDFFANKDAKINTDDFKTRLTTYLHEVAEKENINLTAEDETRLATYIDINTKAYQQYLSFPFLQYLVMGFDTLNRVIPFMLGACFVLLTISAFFMYCLKLTRKMYVAYFSSSLIASSLMIAVLPIFVLVNSFIPRMNFKPECYYNFIVQYLERFLYILLGIALLLIVFAIIMNLINWRFQYMENKKLEG